MLNTAAGLILHLSQSSQCHVREYYKKSFVFCLPRWSHVISICSIVYSLIVLRALNSHFYKRFHAYIFVKNKELNEGLNQLPQRHTIDKVRRTDQKKTTILYYILYYTQTCNLYLCYDIFFK